MSFTQFSTVGTGEPWPALPAPKRLSSERMLEAITTDVAAASTTASPGASGASSTATPRRGVSPVERG